MRTIAAISTAPSAGGIGIIRISGDEATSIADKVFRSMDGTKLSSLKGYRAKFGHVYDQNDSIDQCVALVFKAPNSYTGENVVELSVHGGIFITNKVLQCVLRAGATSALAGEFTKRAFLNGKLDLSAAEAVMKLISSQGEAAARASLNMLEGKLYKKISGILDSLMDCSSLMAAWVDYPDEEIEELKCDNLIDTLQKAKNELENLISSYNNGQIVMEGITTVIAGRPNAGKSTLMNLLSGEEKSIVTSIPGTTRDVVEQSVHLGSLVLHLSDTAGLRHTDNEIEAIGVKRAYSKIKSAALVFAVFDQSQHLNEEDMDLIEQCKNRPCVAIINKNDLEKVIDWQLIENSFEYVLYISAKEEDSLKKLIETTKNALGASDFDPNAPLLAGKRQYECCFAALEAVKEALFAAENGVTYDAINVSLDGAVDWLLQLTGQRATQAVVDKIFENFCVGK